MTKRLRFINSKVKKIRKLCFKKLFDIKSQNTPKTMQTMGKVAIAILWSGLLIGKKNAKKQLFEKSKVPHSLHWYPQISNVLSFS